MFNVYVIFLLYQASLRLLNPNVFPVGLLNRPTVAVWEFYDKNLGLCSCEKCSAQKCKYLLANYVY
jgi:hypothetical protein